MKPAFGSWRAMVCLAVLPWWILLAAPENPLLAALPSQLLRRSRPTTAPGRRSILSSSFADGFVGHHFYLALTPYPYSNDLLENPSLLVSDDGYQFHEERPGTNPLVPRPPVGHNDLDPSHHAETGQAVAVLPAQRRAQPAVAALRRCAARTASSGASRRPSSTTWPRATPASSPPRWSRATRITACSSWGIPRTASAASSTTLARMASGGTRRPCTTFTCRSRPGSSPGT